MTKFVWIAALAFGIAGPAAAEAPASEPATPAASDTPLSEAERMLWMTDQLKAVHSPLSLRYTFKRSGTYEQGFDDTVEFTVTKVKPGGLKDGSLRFFSGERNFPVPPAEDTDVNPVLKVYFQGDVYEMNRLTDPEGKSRERWRYFQRRIKFALAEDATITPVKVTFDGHEYPARAITFAPYRNDPKRKEFEKFAGKSYRVVVSDELPGYVYSIETEIPGAEGAPPLIREQLQLAAVQPQPATKRP